MENKKKQLIYIAVLAACFGLLAWIWMPKFGKNQPADESSATAEASSLGGIEAPAGASQLLPFGEKFDTAVLKDERFRALIAPKALFLDPSELGRVNPFLPPGQEPVLETSTSTATTTPQG